MKNIAIIIQQLNGGGAERCAANLSVELSEYYNVKLIVFDNSNQVYRNGGEVIDLNLPPQRSVVGKIRNSIKRIRKVRKIKKIENIDCSISLLEGANLVNVLSRRKDKVIISERNLISFFETRFLQKMQIKIVAMMADKIVALSEVVKKDLIENFNIKERKIETIYNSCDYSKLIKESKQTSEIIESLDPNLKYVVTTGRLSEQKAQCNLIKSFKLVNNKIPNTCLLVLGQGELESELKDLTIKLGLEKNVIFLGYVSNPHTVIEKCDVFTFTSIVEGLGNVLLEAIACGMPVISCDCDAGPREILAPNTKLEYKTEDIEYGEYGILVPTFKREECNFDENKFNKKHEILYKAIVEILENEQKRNYYKIQAKTRSNDFSPEIISSHWKATIDKILKL